MNELHGILIALSLVVVQLQRLIRILREDAANRLTSKVLLVRIAQKLGVDSRVDVAGVVPEETELEREITNVGAAPAPPPARSAVR